MGDIADDIIEGFQCSWCGQCFEEEHGYPVVCKTCSTDWYKEGHNQQELHKLGLQEATIKEL